MGPKPRPMPPRWSLEEAKRKGAKDTTFDQGPPKLPKPKDRHSEQRDSNRPRKSDKH